MMKEKQLKFDKERKVLLGKPKHGWTEFSLGSTKYELSYLTPVPTEWLDQAIYGMENLIPFVVRGNCEPGRVLCLVSYWNCHVIYEDEENVALMEDETEWEFVHLSMLEFCKMLYADIREHIDTWAGWDCFSDQDEDLYKKEIEKKLEKLHALIIKRWDAFGKCRAFF